VPVDYAVGPGAFEIVSADFNGDGVSDIATANPGSNSVSVLLGNLDDTFQPAVNYSTGLTPVSLAVGDLDGDGKIDDLATANYSDYSISVLLGNNNGSFQPARNVSISSPPSSVSVGDFNGDGLLDLGVTSNVYYPSYYSGYNGGFASYANVILGTGNG